MEEFDFTEEEIQEQLEKLGYHNVPPSRLQEFKRDLEQLVRAEKSGSSGWSTMFEASTDSEATQENPPPHIPHGVADTCFQGELYSNNGKMGNGMIVKESQEGSSLNGRQAGPKPMHTIHMPQVLHEPATPGSPPGGAPSDMDYSMYSQPGDDSVQNGREGQLHSSAMDSSTTSERRLIKRRVVRKRDGQSQVTDELTESELGDMSSLEERLQQIDIPGDTPYQAYPRPVSGPSALDPYARVHQRPRSACSSAPSYRLPDDYIGLKALIRPMKGDPSTRGIKKSDPVSQYQKYNQTWSTQRAPGEKAHKNLRWNVREQMLYHDEVVEKKPQKVYVPNKYTVPSDKKRKGLRWQMRQDLAAGIVPPSVFD